MTDKPARNRIQLGAILLEAFLVVFGVVLALAVNEWREARNRQAVAESALEGIRNEIAANRAAVESSLAQHLVLTDSLVQFAAHLQRTGLTEQAAPAHFFRQGYLRTPTLQSTAWAAAEAIGVLGELDYDQVLPLARVYDDQAQYRSQAETVGGFIFETLFYEGHDAMRANHQNLSNMVGNFMYRECQLLAAYRDGVRDAGLYDDGSEGAPDAELPAVCGRMNIR